MKREIKGWEEGGKRSNNNNKKNWRNEQEKVSERQSSSSAVKRAIDLDREVMWCGRSKRPERWVFDFLTRRSWHGSTAPTCRWEGGHGCFWKSCHEWPQVHARNHVIARCMTSVDGRNSLSRLNKICHTCLLYLVSLVFVFSVTRFAAVTLPAH